VRSRARGRVSRPVAGGRPVRTDHVADCSPPSAAPARCMASKPRGRRPGSDRRDLPSRAERHLETEVGHHGSRPAGGRAAGRSRRARAPRPAARRRRRAPSRSDRTSTARSASPSKRDAGAAAARDHAAARPAVDAPQPSLMLWPSGLALTDDVAPSRSNRSGATAEAAPVGSVDHDFRGGERPRRQRRARAARGSARRARRGAGRRPAFDRQARRRASIACSCSVEPLCAVRAEQLDALSRDGLCEAETPRRRRSRQARAAGAKRRVGRTPPDELAAAATNAPPSHSARSPREARGSPASSSRRGRRSSASCAASARAQPRHRRPVERRLVRHRAHAGRCRTRPRSSLPAAVGRERHATLTTSGFLDAHQRVRRAHRHAPPRPLARALDVDRVVTMAAEPASLQPRAEHPHRRGVTVTSPTRGVAGVPVRRGRPAPARGEAARAAPAPAPAARRPPRARSARRRCARSIVNSRSPLGHRPQVDQHPGLRASSAPQPALRPAHAQQQRPRHVRGDDHFRGTLTNVNRGLELLLRDARAALEGDARTEQAGEATASKSARSTV